MYEFTSSFFGSWMDVLSLIAVGFAFGCGLWLWSQFVEFVDWVLSGFSRKKP